MKKILLIMTIFLFCSFSVFSQSKKKWEITQALNSISAYEDFLKKHPDGKYTELAKQNLEQLEFDNAKQSNTIQGYENFLSKHKKSKYSNEVKNRIDLIKINDDWERATNENTIDAYELFVIKHPISEKTGEVITLIENLDWQNTKTINTLEAFNKFVKKFPNSKYSKEAKSNIDSLEWLSIEKTEELGDLKRYSEKWPNGIHETQVKNRIEELRYQECLTKERYMYYNQFITDYPENKNIPFLKSKLANYKKVMIAEGTTISDNELVTKYHWNKVSEVSTIDDEGFFIDVFNGYKWVIKNFALGNLEFIHAMITKTSGGVYFGEDTELIYKLIHN